MNAIKLAASVALLIILLKVRPIIVAILCLIMSMEAIAE